MKKNYIKRQVVTTEKNMSLYFMLKLGMTYYALFIDIHVAHFLNYLIFITTSELKWCSFNGMI